jgi:ABC-2 type transport system ATP-binding protein
MMLALTNITKKYDNINVLQGISFVLSPGIYGLLGANGAGKTTLFRVICGIIKPDEGSVDFNNKDTQKNREFFLSELGFLPQDFAYYSNFTGLKFMLYIASLKGLNKQQAKKKLLNY